MNDARVGASDLDYCLCDVALTSLTYWPKALLLMGHLHGERKSLWAVLLLLLDAGSVLLLSIC